MTKKAKAILEQALKLSPAERLRVAQQIEESVEEADDVTDLSPEWRHELRRRLERVVTGKTKGVSGDEALAIVRRALKEQQAARGKKTSR
jgi:putative addiction module component (TIGR02574 family)